MLWAAVAGVALAVGAVTPGQQAAPQAPERAAAAVETPLARAEALLRKGQFKEAADVAARVLADAGSDAGAQAARAAYLHGYASFALKDYGSAVRSLATLAPFGAHGDMGLHARYLLGRVHHLAGERPEAVADYEAVVTGWEGRGREARARLATGDVPAADRAGLEAAAKAAAPDYVARAAFYWGVVLGEFGRSDEAMAKLVEAVRLAPDSAVAAEARLRAAEAGVAVRKYAEVIDVVTPLVEDARWGDQALRYLAKAQYGAGLTPVAKGRGVTAQLNAQPDPQLVAQGVRNAIETLRKADEKANAVTGSDAQAAARRAVILLELGDMLQLDRQHAEAAKAYREAAACAPKDADVAERSLERQAAALQLAGEYVAADKACTAFLDRFDKSALRGEVALRHAENALLAAHAKREGESKGDYVEAVARFNRVIDHFPETTEANLARVGLATVHYLEGRFAEAAGVLAKIPEHERGAELAGAALLQADCELRAIPATADDALTGARVAQQLEQVTVQLEGFVAGRPADDPAVADAWVRIGYASQRLAALLADPTEKRRTLAKARRAYATVVQQFPNHPLYPVALIENAKTLLRFNGNSPAMMELSKFQASPLDKSPLAPLALVHLADVQRARRQPAEAVRMLTEIREQHEAAWLKDPNRVEWVVAMRQALGLAYKEAGKFAEARDVFEKLAADFAKRPEAAEAAWRVAQCETDPALADVENNRRALAAAGRPAMQEEVLARQLEATNRLRAGAERMAKEAEAVAARGDESDLPQRMNHDAAYCWKVVGEVEVEAARRAIRAEAMKKAEEQAAAAAPPPPERGKKRAPAPAPIRPQEVALSSIPVQPGEKRARERFRAVMEAGGESSPLADEARTELIESYGQRGEADEAIALVKEALAAPRVTPDVTERLKLRLASLQLEKGDAKAAAATAAELLAPERGGGERGYSAYARAIAVESAYRAKNYAAAVEAARTILETPRGIGRLGGVADVVLLRVADAQGRLGKWREARDTIDLYFARFGNGGLMGMEARLAQGWVSENLGERDRAIEAYTMAATRAGGELAAQAKARVERLRDVKAAEARPDPAEAPVSGLAAPRIPSLLVTQRRFSSGGSPTVPASPVVTPAVNNPDGTGTFAMLSPAARGIRVEVAPLVSRVVPAEEAYVQSPAARDEADVPANR